MRILISGASGLIGTSLCEHLSQQGHDVVKLVRRAARAPHEISWNPADGEIPHDAMQNVDAVINLAGAGVGDKRWTKRYKREILQSRLDATQTLVKAISTSSTTPKVFLNASAIGFYGDRKAEVVDETSIAGSGFLADVVTAWEAAAMPLQASGVRVALLRTGLVLTPKGGAFAKLLPLFKLGLGGQIGNGQQYWSFISLTDEVRAIEFLLTHPVSGPVNLTAPHPVTNKEATRALAKLLRRPALLPVPAFALRIVIGEFAEDITTGACIKPKVLSDAGFTWLHPSIDLAIKAEVLPPTVE